MILLFYPVVKRLFNLLLHYKSIIEDDGNVKIYDQANQEYFWNQICKWYVLSQSQIKKIEEPSLCIWNQI
jgi:hypothetical protein